MILKTSLLIFLVTASVTAFASDHNNLDKERPLHFEDAYSSAFKSWEIQTGLRLDTFKRQSPVYNLRTELQYGFGKNKDISIGFEPVFFSESGRIYGNFVEISYFEGIRREIQNNPAIGYRLEGALPVSGQNGGSRFSARGIFTKTLNHYDKVHLNLDISVIPKPASGERHSTIGAILGYSTPIGYPRKFDQTLLAEIGIEQSHKTDENLNTWIGIGLRQQISEVGVFDFGLQSDLTRKNSDISPFRFSIGYSITF